jgi:N-acetylmuramic acid 6-phosphate etherase
MLDLSKLATEQRNPNTLDLDEMSPLDIVSTMNKEDENVVNAVT